MRQEGGGGGAPVDRAEDLLQSLEDIIVKPVVSLQPLENHGETDTYPAAHGGLHATASGCALKEAAACGGRTRKASLTFSTYWKSMCKCQRAANSYLLSFQLLS